MDTFKGNITITFKTEIPQAYVRNLKSLEESSGFFLIR